MKYLRKLVLSATCALVIPILSGAAQAADGFNPKDNCFQIVSSGNPATKMMLGAWVFGYLAAKQSDPRPVDFGNIDTILGNLADFCGQNQDMSVLAMVERSSKPSADTAGSEAHARALLMDFYTPGADLNALTQALIPSETDIRAVYREPLASKMVAFIAENFHEGVTFSPKPEHDDLLVTYATTSNLRDGDAVLREFPGGYKDIVQYMNEGFPIVRFKFITKGETLGLAFDGLIFVNDHWVIMPKPWRLMQ